MNYQKIYDTLVRRGQNRILEGYSEKHHIVPRCLGGTDDATNLVSLTPEEHYLCHLLLVKIHPNNIRLVKAAMFMVSANKDQQRNNKAYGWLKRQYSEYMSGPNNPSKLNGVWNKGVTGYKNKVNFSEKTINAMTERMKTKNPCAGVKPWNHPRATDYSKSVWKQADLLYNVWITHNKPSYCKLYTLWNNKCYTNESKVIGPYMNMVKYFKNGWIPTQDQEWFGFKGGVV
jgi:hypothetical protein